MRKSTILAILLTALFTVAIMWLCTGQPRVSQESEHMPDTTRTVSIDTVAAVNPAPVDVSVINTKVVRLPLWISPAKRKALEDSTLTVDVNDNVNDSADVVLPIEQKTYTDSNSYRAVISGAFVTLDTIEVYRRTEVVNITHPPSKPKRWGIGLSAGYAITPRGLQPYMGIGFSYTLFRL